MSNYAILRFGKIKTQTQLKASQGHCNRTRTTANADPSKAAQNRQLLGEIGLLMPKVEALLHAAAKQRKIRPDANLVCEIFLGASPEWFRDGELKQPLNPQRVEAFVARVSAFLEEAFGDHCLSAVLHLDEETPHVHAHFIPLHRGNDKHPAGGWLSWEDWFGGRQKLQTWQDQYAAALQPLGLERGIKGSTASHEAIKDFYGRVMQTLEVPDLERAFTLPTPQAAESAAAYHQRLSEHFAQALPAMQDDLKTLEAQAKNAERQKRKAKETTNTLHVLTEALDDLEQQRAKDTEVKQQLQTDKEHSLTGRNRAIARELLATAELVLYCNKTNRHEGKNYIISRSKTGTSIHASDGRWLVRHKNGQAVLNPKALKPADIQYFRQQQQQLSQVMFQQFESTPPQDRKRTVIAAFSG